MNDIAAAVVEMSYIMGQKVCPTCGGLKAVWVPGTTCGYFGPQPGGYEPCPDCEGKGAERRDDEPAAEPVPFCERGGTMSDIYRRRPLSGPSMDQDVLAEREAKHQKAEEQQAAVSDELRGVAEGLPERLAKIVLGDARAVWLARQERERRMHDADQGDHGQEEPGRAVEYAGDAAQGQRQDHAKVHRQENG